MYVAALQTSRAGSQGVPRKNELIIAQIPLFLHNLRSAVKSRLINHTYAISDIPAVHQYAASTGYTAIDLPDAIAKGNHYDAILEGIKRAEELAGTIATIVVVLLGNSLGATTQDLDAAISLLLERTDFDSVCSVSQFDTFNPTRAYKLNKVGELETIVPQSVIAQLLGEAPANVRTTVGASFFFNGSFWVCRRETLLSRGGFLPFPWLGKKIGGFVQELGYMEIDDKWQIPVLESIAH